MIGSSDKGWRSTSARNNEVQPQRLPGGAESAGIQSSGDGSFATMGEVGSARRASGLLEHRFPRQPPCTTGIRADYLLGFILAPVVRSRSNQHDGMDLGSSGSPLCSPLTSVCRSSRLAGSVPVPSGSAPPRLCRLLLAATEKPPPTVPAINYTS